MDITTTIISLVILLFSAILHEIAHGAVAEYFGDYTARDLGRISLNPLVHIDPFMTVLLPLFLALSHSPFIFGGAKPVPVNYNNLRNYRWGIFWVSIAGILTNLALAIIFLLPFRFFAMPVNLGSLFVLIAEINIILAVFNLIPFPPLDGAKVFSSLLGEDAIEAVARFERRGVWATLPFLFIFLFLIGNGGLDLILSPVMNFFFRIFGVI
ncbi:MAG: peptidase [Candidatus Doudnabacteria bacterium]|nr:peptidase [Candidatus Doudnabacteria bacterium]